MDPMTDLPPAMATHLADHISDPPPAQPTSQRHPPYPEMIAGAITALNDKDGSSRQAISKYIEKEYTNLPPTHSILLTQHLKRLRNEGHLIMVKYSYMFPPRSDQFQPPPSTDYNSSFNFTVTETVDANHAPDVNPPPTNSAKRKPGRPPKNRSDSVVAAGVQTQMQNVQPYDAAAAEVGVQTQMQNVQPYDAAAAADADVDAYQPQFQYNVGVGEVLPVNSDFQGNAAASGSEPLFASLGLGDDGVAAVPENSGVKRGRGRPPKVKRGVGRPRRSGVGAVTVPLSGNVLGPRRRPKRAGRLNNVGVNGGVGESRRSGRPHVSRFGGLTGKPLGKPSKAGPGTAVIVTDPRQLVVYQELKSKYDFLQSKIKQLAVVVKPCIDPNYGTVALQALQELEALAGADTNGPSHVQIQEPEPEPAPAPAFPQN